MNIRQITESITYVGVNDRTTSLFEALWPLPYGVSYNSYLVKGAKTALIDTVELGRSREFFDHLHTAVGGAGIDYLVVNHMEPDHSGAIPDLMARYPELKVVGNGLTLSMIRGFYGVCDESRLIEVGDGGCIDLGAGRKLKFFLTPMVHWPETMMTYLESERVLFSGDAFGTFGCLNGGITDVESDVSVHLEEAYRYYSNIVGKYGKFVQRALARLTGLDMEYICPTHGPVWHDRIGDIVRLTDRLSSYRSEPGVTIVYGSMYGNTAELAEVIAGELAACGIRTIRIHDASTSSMSQMISDAFRYKGLIVGSPTYSMKLFPPVEQFMNALETREVTGKVLGTFGSFTWAPAALKRLDEFASRLAMKPLGSFSMKQAPGPADLEAARELGRSVAEEVMRSENI